MKGIIIFVLFIHVYVYLLLCTYVCVFVQTFEVNLRAIGLLNCLSVFCLFMFYILVILLRPFAGEPPQQKCNLFLTPHMMVSGDSVRSTCEEHWHGTKQPAIYVWNINKIFCVLSTRKVDLFKVIILICCIF